MAKSKAKSAPVETITLRGVTHHRHPSWDTAGPMLIGEICDHVDHGKGRIRSVSTSEVIVTFGAGEFSCHPPELMRTIECLEALRGEQGKF